VALRPNETFEQAQARAAHVLGLAEEAIGEVCVSNETHTRVNLAVMDWVDRQLATDARFAPSKASIGAKATEYDAALRGAADAEVREFEFETPDPSLEEVGEFDFQV
jgi:hypothetical protein